MPGIRADMSPDGFEKSHPNSTNADSAIADTVIGI
jgi:hypothetical protein